MKVKETQQSLTAYFGVRDGSKPENYIEAGTNGNCGLALVDADFTKMITVIDSTGKEISGNDIEGNAREFGGFLLFGPIKPNDVNQINIIADTYLEFRKELNKVGLSNRAINALQPLAGLALSIFKENDPKLYKKLLYNKNDLYYKLAENLNQIERIIIDNIKEDKVFKVLPKDKYAKFAANWLLRTEAKAIKDFYEQHIQVLTAPTIALYLNQARGGQQKDKVA